MSSLTAKELVENLDKSLGTPDSTPDYPSSASSASSAPPPTSSTLKHFECTEVDIDFKNISDVIDTEEPDFGVPTPDTSAEHSSITTTATIPANNSQKWKSNNGGSITLKKHKEVIYEMYKVAKRKAQEAKKVAIRAYLEAKEIKASYLLDDLDESSGSGSDEEED
jgi:hypothetical protein